MNLNRSHSYVQLDREGGLNRRKKGRKILKKRIKYRTSRQDFSYDRIDERMPIYHIDFHKGDGPAIALSARMVIILSTRY